MKETDALQVLGDFSFDEKTVNIHPNDGFDLGLMMSSHVVEMYTGITPDELPSADSTGIYGKINLKNECKMGTVELSLKSVERMGGPKQVKLFYQDGDRYGRLLIHPAPAG
jgi:hypothetical protein